MIMSEFAKPRTEPFPQNVNPGEVYVHTSNWVWYFLMFAGLFWSVGAIAMWLEEPSALHVLIEVVGASIFLVSLIRLLRGNVLVSCNKQELAFYYRPIWTGFRLQKIIIPTQYLLAVEHRAGCRYVNGISYEQFLFAVVSREWVSLEFRKSVQVGCIRLLRSTDDDSFVVRQAATFKRREMESLVTFIHDHLGLPAVSRKIADKVQPDEMLIAKNAAAASSYGR
jgi:hypothetical protein